MYVVCSHQHTVEKMREVQLENIDLKESVSQLEDIRKDLQLQLKHIRKDSVHLEQDIMSLQNQVSSDII